MSPEGSASSAAHERPKSSTLGVTRPVRSRASTMFDGSRSRCTTPSSCAADTALATGTSRSAARAGSSSLAVEQVLERLAVEKLHHSNT